MQEKIIGKLFCSFSAIWERALQGHPTSERIQLSLMKMAYNKYTWDMELALE